MNRARTLALALALLWGVAVAQAPTPPAAAPTFPPDAELIITEVRGVIVGVGRIVDGASFELALLTGFEGAARLTVLQRDGTTWTLEVQVADAVVRIDGVDLLELLPASVAHVSVRLERAAGAARGPGAGLPDAARGAPPVDPPALGRPAEPPAGPRAPDVPGKPSGPPDEVPGGDDDADEGEVDTDEPDGDAQRSAPPSGRP